MVFSNKGLVDSALAVCPKEDMIGCVCSHQARKSWKARLVLREGGKVSKLNLVNMIRKLIP